METIIELSKEEQRVLDMLTYSETAEKLNYKEQRKITFWVTNNLLELYYEVLSELDEKCHKFKINSGYRCSRTNLAVKGVMWSQHMTGNAADVTCDNLPKMWKILQEMEVDQAIRYKNFIHVSYVTNRKNRNQYIDKTLTEKKGGVK